MKCSQCGFDSEAVPKKSYIITLEGEEAPSVNEVGANSYGRSGYKYRNYRKRYEKLLGNRSKEISKATRLRRIFFLRKFASPKYAYDYGNLVGGFKPLLDTIVRIGWLKDDNPKWSEQYYRQEKSSEDSVVIVIEEL